MASPRGVEGLVVGDDWTLLSAISYLVHCSTFTKVLDKRESATMKLKKILHIRTVEAIRDDRDGMP